MFCAQLLFALVQLQNPDFVTKNYYDALTAILIGTMVTAINVWGAKKLAFLENIFVALHVAGFFVVLITVAVTSPKAGAKEVFTSFTDNGGNYPLSKLADSYLRQLMEDRVDANLWLVVGLALMVGQVPAMWNVLASDAVAHICKSDPRPSPAKRYRR